ncbi:cytochrome P450 [Nonomuraea antri]|uniref:cytochrome P450 n=1 Tax=Nonomuraea antri TaxID=2730852 RepID=UPI002E27EAF7|nr:cytochrome P450 [Nonomuraea antri]
MEELLRYLNITHSGRRRVALEDIEIAGQVIRAGEGMIMANDIGNHHDPGVFAHPDELDLWRDARRHVAFGFRVHQCLGQPPGPAGAAGRLRHADSGGRAGAGSVQARRPGVRGLRAAHHLVRRSVVVDGGGQDVLVELVPREGDHRHAQRDEHPAL